MERSRSTRTSAPTGGRVFAWRGVGTLVVRGRRRQIGQRGRRGLRLSRLAAVVMMVAVGAYAAGANNLVRMIDGAIEAPPPVAAAPVIVAAADTGFVAAEPAAINRAEKTDRLEAAIALASPSLVKVAALFAPTVTVANASVVKSTAAEP